jgi:A1 cistron-splicing factor AAR2
MDRSKQLEELISREYPGNDLAVLGELQLAYIAFLLGQNCDGFDQWRALLQMLCSCDDAVAAKPELFAELLRTFFAQLSQAPSDLFGDDLTDGNFLGSCALGLLEACDAEAAPAKMRKRCGKLRELVLEKFGINTDDLALLGEDAPQIVDADGRDLINLGSGLVDMD